MHTFQTNALRKHSSHIDITRTPRVSSRVKQSRVLASNARNLPKYTPMRIIIIKPANRRPPIFSPYHTPPQILKFSNPNPTTFALSPCAPAGLGVECSLIGL